MRGGTEYSFVGAENTFFSEETIEEMAIRKIKPGDIIYQVAECEEESIVWFDAVKVVDVATKEVKIFNDWIDFDECEMFTEESKAEEYAIKLAKELGYEIVKGGLFTKEVADGRE